MEKRRSAAALRNDVARRGVAQVIHSLMVRTPSISRSRRACGFFGASPRSRSAAAAVASCVCAWHVAFSSPLRDSHRRRIIREFRGISSLERERGRCGRPDSDE